MGGRARSGGIRQLCRLAVKHPAELARDLREKCGASLWDIGTDALPLGEAFYLVQTLLRDPSSWLQAAVAEWDHPVSREWVLLAQIHDITLASKVKRAVFKPWARPWPEKKTKIGGKKTVRRSIKDTLAILRPQRTE